MSTRIRLDAFKKLYTTDSGLYHALLGVSKAERGGEIILVQDQDLRGQAFVEAWGKFVRNHPEAVVATEQPQDELWAETQAQANRDAEKARLAEGAKAAAAQYAVWLKQGLENTPENEALIINWIKANTECPSAGATDAAIRALGPGGTGQLAWKKAAAEPVVPAAPPPPPPVILSDGSEQLPLGTIPRGRHTKAQLQDLDRREREARNAAVRAANNEVALAFRNAAAQSAPLEVL